MAENIHINLTEDLEQDLLQEYQGLCEAIEQNLSTMAQDLEKISQDTQYEPIVNAVNATVQLFNEDIHDGSCRVFDEWIEGEASFQAAVENSQAGDSALETARSIESKIREMFEEFWLHKPLGDGVDIDTSRPKVSDGDFDELKDIYTKYSQEIETVGEETKSRINEQGQDDPTYDILLPAVTALTEPMKKAFEGFSTKIDEAKEMSENMKQQQKSRNEEAAEAAMSASVSAEEIAQVLSMYDDI